MKAMIFAAGLGSRLKPLTDTMPKALVPVAGKPMLEHVLLKLKEAGFREIVINIHHFGQQIIDFVSAHQAFGLTIHFSDERDELLDTGGGILVARRFLEASPEPFLVHNVDILSNIDLASCYQEHKKQNRLATLLVSRRETSRNLLVNGEDKLCGWINKDTGALKPLGFDYLPQQHRMFAFSGIHILSPQLFETMEKIGERKFSIMDFYLGTCQEHTYHCSVAENLRLIDIGKPETLEQADAFLSHLSRG